MTINKLTLEQEKYIEYIDSDYGYEIAKKLTEFKTNDFGFRNAGTAAENAAADWIAEEMKKIGLEDVTKEDVIADAWEFKGASVELLGPDFSCNPMFAGCFAGLDGTSEEGISGEVVYVKAGIAKYYEGIDVTDKIVFIDTDAYHTFWYNVIFEQAQARGAKAIIAAVTDCGPGTYTDDLITIQDIQGFVDIPAVMLNKGDSELIRDLLVEDNNISVNIKINATIRKDATAHLVYGKIKGKNPEKQLIVGGHYDAYWDGFLDNASSLGSSLVIAKAMIDSGYEPDGTIIFLSNGAEEFGKCNCFFDYCTGSTSLLEEHTDWADNTVSCTNFELTAHDQMESFSVTVSACYAKWFRSILENLGEAENMVFPTSMCGADNIVFVKAGIPTCMNITTAFDTDDKESASNYDHTQYDNVDRFDKNAFDKTNRMYGLMNILIDRTPVIPFDFTFDIEKFFEDQDMDLMRKVYADTDSIVELVAELKAKAAAVYEKCSESDEPDWQKTKKMLEINRVFTKNIYKYDSFACLMVGHTQPLNYVGALDALIAEIESGSVGEALDGIKELDNNYLIDLFDKIVYEKTSILAFDESVWQGWGKDATIPVPDLYDVLTSITAKTEEENAGFDSELAILKNMRNQQVETLISVLEDEKKYLERINSLFIELD